MFMGRGRRPEDLQWYHLAIDFQEIQLDDMLSFPLNDISGVQPCFLTKLMFVKS